MSSALTVYVVETKEIGDSSSKWEDAGTYLEEKNAMTRQSTLNGGSGAGRTYKVRVKQYTGVWTGNGDLRVFTSSYITQPDDVPSSDVDDSSDDESTPDEPTPEEMEYLHSLQRPRQWISVPSQPTAPSTTIADSMLTQATLSHIPSVVDVAKSTLSSDVDDLSDVEDDESTLEEMEVKFNEMIDSQLKDAFPLEEIDISAYVKKNRWDNYVIDVDGLDYVFSMNIKKVIGTQLTNGDILPLDADDASRLINLGWPYITPEEFGFDGELDSSVISDKEEEPDDEPYIITTNTPSSDGEEEVDYLHSHDLASLTFTYDGEKSDPWAHIRMRASDVRFIAHYLRERQLQVLAEFSEAVLYQGASGLLYLDTEDEFYVLRRDQIANGVITVSQGGGAIYDAAPSAA